MTTPTPVIGRISFGPPAPSPDLTPYESTIQSQILARIGARPRFRFWRQNSGLLAAPVTGRRMRAGVPGIADIGGIFAPAGRAIHLEVKRPGEHLDEKQFNWGTVARQFGAVYDVVHSADEAAALLDDLEAGIYVPSDLEEFRPRRKR